MTTTFTIATAIDLANDLLAINVGGVDALPGATYVFNFTTNFVIGSTQTIDLAPGASVTFAGGHQASGSGFEIEAGTLIATTLAAIGPGAIAIDLGGVLNLNQFPETIAGLSGAGSLTLNSELIDNSTSATTFSGTLSGFGNLEKIGSGDLTLSHTGNFDGQVSLEAGSLILAAANAMGTGTLTFSGSPGEILSFSSAAAPISNSISAMVTGGTLDLTGQLVTATNLINSNTLQIVLNSGGPIDLTMDQFSSYVGDFFHFTNSGTDNFIIMNTTPCYLAGTSILTAHGEVKVESLAIGDLVVTLDGSAQPIKWIGRRSFSSAFAAGNRDVVPILIRAGALAENVPVRDLYVSPLHAMYIDNVLIPAEHLVNGASIVRCPEIDPIRYFHIELERHGIIFADGAPAETFVDCDSRGMFHNVREFAALYPSDTAPAWVFCAPRVESGRILERARRRIDARAGLQPVRTGAVAEGTCGNLDGIDGNSITGWAYDPERPDQPVTLEVLDGDGLLAQVVANRYRDDLVEAGYGDGRHGFELRLASGLSPLTSHCIRVRRAGGGVELTGSPLVLKARPANVSRIDAHLAIEAAARSAQDTDSLDALLTTLLEGTDHTRQLRAARWDLATHSPDPAGRGGGKSRRVLVIDDSIPVPDRDAGSNAILSHIAALQGLGWQVELVASDQSARDRKHAVALEEIGVVCHCAPFVASVEEVLRRQRDRFQMVYLHRLRNAEAYAGLVRAWQPKARVVYSVADLHHVRLERQAAVQSNPELLDESREIRRRELAAMRMCDAVVTHSTVEAGLLAQHVPAAAIHVVPWSVPTRRAAIPAAARPDAVAFVGGYRHAPNPDAARWLVTEIMPLVWASRPETNCLIVGSEWPAQLSWISDPRVRLIGQLGRLGGAFDLVRATVAPLRFGSGVKGKVLESLAAGVPCVMTSIAAEGIPLGGRLLELVADEAAGIAASICRVLGDEASHHAYGEAGLAMIEERFSAEMVQRAMRAVAPRRGRGGVASGVVAEGLALTPARPVYPRQAAAGRKRQGVGEARKAAATGGDG
jgi:autotransporter-associated beta strand protein